KVTQDLEREKTNLLQETKENRDNKNKTTEEKICDSLHNNLDVTKTTNTRVMSTNEPHMETLTNAPKENATSASASSSSQKMSIDRTSKDKTIEDQKEAPTASRNNDNVTVETEEVEPIASTSMNTNPYL
ncbi:10935_t:CDS:2, partial [Scutellospora calospora]